VEASLVPPGWRDNPSEWKQRLPIAALAAGGFAVASYLALYQYGVVGAVWEPFFGDGSARRAASSLVPVADPADLLGQRSGRGRQDPAGGRVGQRLHRQQGAAYLGCPPPRVATVPDPRLPEAQGVG
jgi:hypothetical protein